MHRLLERQIRKLGIASVPTEAQWTEFVQRVDRAYTEADQDRYTQERALELSSNEMRERYAELRDAQRALIEASRKAGMADVAASVLHNIGNVLNSANVSTKVLIDTVARSARGGLGKTLGLLSAQPQPGAFIDGDPRGQKLIPYLTMVDQKLTEEHNRLTSELQALGKHIEHLKAIVGQQLESARSSKSALVLERVPLDELVRDAIEMSELTRRPGIALVCELDNLVVEIDRHKFTQIVVNLLRNASDAIKETGQSGTVTVRAQRGPECQAVVEIQDTGLGIDPELKKKIFNHGFTTKETGNGYGLHHSACTAIELGGNLSCESEGKGRGATFTLRFPRKRGERTASCSRLAVSPELQRNAE